MRIRLVIFAICSFIFSIWPVSPVNAQENTENANTNIVVEGTVVSFSRTTLVVQTDNNQFELFTYTRNANRPRSLARGARVRVGAGPANDAGTRAAFDVMVLNAAPTSGTSAPDKGAQAAPVPEKVTDVENDIKRESRRWRLGVRAGAAFDPELFTFGVQSQMGPIFHRGVLFRPNAEFAFGEVTDLVAVNLEGIYQFSPASRRGNWTPYVGGGPALLFIQQSYSQSRDISFSNFNYKTGFNVLVGTQSRHGTFVELKTSLYSGPAPKLRLIVGYVF